MLAINNMFTQKRLVTAVLDVLLRLSQLSAFDRLSNVNMKAEYFLKV
jgi:hypothetical protein